LKGLGGGSDVIRGARSRRRPRIFLVGYYGVGNLGDEMIRLAIEREAKALGVEIATYANWGPANDSDPRAVRVRGRGLLRYVRACLTADRVVLGGGGILKDEGIRMPIELLVTVLLARLSGRPVALLNVGVGPFYSRLGRTAVKAIARMCEYRSVRDQESADALEALGVRAVETTADPVFCVVGDADAECLQSSTQVRGRPGRTAVVNVRPWFLRSEPERWDRLAHTIAGALNDSLPRDLDVHFSPFYWPRDRDAAADVAKHLERPAAIPESPHTLETALALTQTARLAVAMRYHAVLMAVASGCPTIAIAYEPKVSALAQQLGVASVSVDDPDLRSHLRERVADALTRPPTIGSEVARLRDLARRSIGRALVGS
jgi:polysaccharide pyruvyl transferase CsaB